MSFILIGELVGVIGASKSRPGEFIYEEKAFFAHKDQMRQMIEGITLAVGDNSIMAHRINITESIYEGRFVDFDSMSDSR